MPDEVLRLTTQTIDNLRQLAVTLNRSGHPGSALRLHGFAGMLKEMETELAFAQAKADADKRERERRA